MQFYIRWPFDDFHRYHRPAALIGAINAGESQVQSLLDWLQPPIDVVEATLDPEAAEAAGWNTFLFS